MKILVADEISGKGLSLLKDSGHDIDVRTGLKEEELVEIIGDYDVLIVRSNARVTDKVIKASRLQVIGRAGVGVDNIDLEAATAKGILVMNAPSGNIVATAELTLALMFCLLRNIVPADRTMKEERWEKKKLIGRQLGNKTLGIVGLGRVGTEVAKRSKALGMNILAHDPFLSPELAERMDVRLVSLDTLLAESDIVTIHTILNSQTRNLIGRVQLAKMKPSAFLINTARGGIVNEEALCEALREKRIAGAAVDVYTQEPPENWSLIKQENCLATPHLGASTKEAQEEVGFEIAEQIALYLSQGIVKNAVNLPAPLDPELIPYLELSDKLGEIAVQLSRRSVSAIEVKCSGEIIGKDVKILVAGAVAGVLKPIFAEGKVNIINAFYIARDRGINIISSTSEASPKFKNLLEVAILSDGLSCSIAGTYFPDKGLRIVQVQGHPVEFEPKGIYLFTEHSDRPGVIGAVGTILGQNNINIAHMDVARDQPRGSAIMILNLDDEVPPEIIDKLRTSENIKEVTQIIL
ncbi:MAG: D-3-phosphoglycerate dehydrogenase [Syntrophus sp. PtaB.Bin001]|nr:MAG: D-3-phosphoglycerate dehydrogenase [Syntrophus sp. PtaB.Bin001]